MHPLALLLTLGLTIIVGGTTVTRIRDELFHPIVVLNGIVLFYIIAPAWKLLLVGGYSPRHANPGGQLAQTLAVVLVSYLAILWAYRRTRPDAAVSPFIPRWRDMDTRALLVLGVLGFATGLVFYLYYVLVNGGFVRLLTVAPRTAFAGPDTLRFHFLGFAGIFGGLITVLAAYRPRVVEWDLDVRDGALLGGLIVITFLVALSVRSRMNIVVPAAYLLLYADGTDRLPRRYLVMGGTTLFVIGVTYTFFESLISARDVSLVYLVTDGVVSSIRVEVLMQVISNVPETHPYQHGATLLRSFGITWPGAPLTYGNQLEVIVYGEDHPYTSFPALILGELWLNFGLVGVLVGSVAFGWALKVVSSLRRRTESTSVMSLYPLLFLGVIAAYPTSIAWAIRGVWLRIVLPVVLSFVVATWISNSAFPTQLGRTRGRRDEGD